MGTLRNRSAIWLALWSISCGESSTPDPTDTTGSGSAAGSVTAPSTQATTSAAQTTPALQPTSGGPAGSSTGASTTLQPGATGGGTGTTSSAPVAPSVTPSSNPASTSPATGSASEVSPTATSSNSTTSEEAPPEPVVEPTLIMSGENGYWQIGEPMMGTGSATVTVDPDQELQDWNGFGGTFNEAGWEALSHLSQADRELAIRLLFDARDGAAFTMARIPIGSSDYGLSPYSLNDSPTPDPEMNNFSIERDRMHLIPYIKAALAVKPDVVLWGSPWSPPPWMKSNNAFNRGNMLSEHLGAHALYLARFVEEYAKEGIDVSAVHPQNEPGYLQDYPSCGWTGEQMATYLREHLGPLFAERLPNTQVWLGTLSNAQSDHAIGQAVMGDAGAKSFLSGVGLQWAMQGNAAYYVQQGLPVMQTEHQCGNFPPTPRSQQYESAPAPNDHAYALESWGLLYNWITKGVNSYLAWNMVLDTMGTNLDTVRPWNQNALLVVDEGAGTLRATPTYYVFRHLAQYVEPGAKRVASDGQSLAFKNPDGSIVTVVHNQDGSAAPTTLALGSTTLQFTVPARGWATVNWQAQ